MPSHLVGVLYVQEVLKNRRSSEALGSGTMAKAMVQLVREQNEKRRKDKVATRSLILIRRRGTSTKASVWQGTT